jgi:1,4-dihydroxy-2-naphthoate octaprenyltransferase
MNSAMNMPVNYKTAIKGWFMMARPPFHSVGVLPFCLGAALAWRSTGTMNWQVFLWGTLAVILIMLTTYLAGEYYDLDGDRLSGRMGRNMFSGGSQALVKDMVPRQHARIGSYISLILAGLIGLLLQFHYKTGPWTIPLGLIGMITGFFYSTEPIRFVKRGIGEILIGFSYGWLPIAASFYLQTAHLTSLVHWMSLPIGFTIFNVIFINEFPDYPADLITKKATLVVRFGKKNSSYLYSILCVGALILFPFSTKAGLHPYTLIFFLPIAALSFMTTSGMLRGRYTDRAALEKMCGITILINLLYSLSFILGLLVWGL